MKYRSHTVVAAGLMALTYAVPVVAGEGDERAIDTPYAPLLQETRPLATRWQTDYSGALELGVNYTSRDNAKFGQYNGHDQDRAALIGNLRWQQFSSDSYWRVSGADLGLATREGNVTWGLAERIKIVLDFDSQVQARNNSGRTPFVGGAALTLPQGWVSGMGTGQFSALETALREVEREREREKIALGLDYTLSKSWHLDARLAYESIEGTADTTGALYSEGATGYAVQLPLPVDQRVAEFDVGLAYSGSRLHVQGRLDHSDFDNKDDVLVWQNPYDYPDPMAAYPQGAGGLGLAPDNSQTRGRLTGQYILSPQARFQFDGSYAMLNQDQDYLDYSVNPALASATPLPRESLDGDVENATLNLALTMQPLRKMTLKAYFHARERDYDVPRDGYSYVRGDAGAAAPAALTVYNTAHDYLSRTRGIDVSYRLPLRGRVSLEYAYETVERRNAAVEETEEDQFTLALRLQPWNSFSARLQAYYGNRLADRYNWDQRYYALLDPGLINATPDNQRYINHPDLTQYHLSNRHRTETRADFSWQPAEQWNLNLNLLWRDDDHDKSELGLTGSEWQRGHISVNYAASASLNASFYGGYDRYESDQSSRSFRGGQEKNAFEDFAPLPQASDPARDWRLNSRDESLTAGLALQWLPTPDLELEADYNCVDTQSRQGLDSVALQTRDLPDVDTTLHHLDISGIWHSSAALSLRLQYQYYRYKSDDYVLTGSPLGIDKVLTFGDSNPDEKIHYIGAAAIYRWK